jgi:hypothetical protein
MRQTALLKVKVVTALFSLNLVLQAKTASGAKGDVMSEAEVEGTLASLGSDGKVTAQPNMTVKLACRQTVSPSDGNHQQTACVSELSIERAGRLVARRNQDLEGIDYEHAAGNSASLTLTLLPWVGEANLIVLSSEQFTGDEWHDLTITEQWLVWSGKTLQEVFRYPRVIEHDPGPESRERVRRSETRMTFSRHRTAGLPDLVGKGGTETTTATWQRKQYLPCPHCRVQVPPEGLPPGTPASLVDSATQKSIEPLLAKVFAGRLLVPADITPLSAESLSRLKNAPFARYGRPFKSADLQLFFYGPRGEQRAGSLLPLEQNRYFVDDTIEPVDRANVELLAAEIKRRQKKK